MNTLLHTNYTETRPWGSFIRFALNEPVTVKIITVNAGEEFSLQSHAHRSEFWRIISGSGIVTVGTEQFSIIPNAEYEIPAQTEHRIVAGHESVVLLEIARGTFDENDITRFEDRYGRT